MQYPLGMKLTDRTEFGIRAVCTAINLAYGCMVTAAPAVLQNVVNCVERCRLQIADFAVNPYAAGIAMRGRRRTRSRCHCRRYGRWDHIDRYILRGRAGACRYDLIGGAHITSDIAQGFSSRCTTRNGLKRSTELACLRRQMRSKSSVFPVLAKKKTQAPTLPKSFLVSIIARGSKKRWSCAR